MPQWKDGSLILLFFQGYFLDGGARNTWEPAQWADGSSNGTLRGISYVAQNWDRSPCLLYKVQHCWGLGKYVLPKHSWPQGQEVDDGQLICHSKLLVHFHLRKPVNWFWPGATACCQFVLRTEIIIFSCWAPLQFNSEWSQAGLSVLLTNWKLCWICMWPGSPYLQTLASSCHQHPDEKAF